MDNTQYRYTSELQSNRRIDMKKLVIAMIVTNIFLASQIMADRKVPNTDKLDKQICVQELIPIPEEELEVD